MTSQSTIVSLFHLRMEQLGRYRVWTALWLICCVFTFLSYMQLISQSQNVHVTMPSHRDANVIGWIVITNFNSKTSHTPTHVPGWKILLLAADMNTRGDIWRGSDIIFLDIERQDELCMTLFPRLPRNSFTRKMVGYLYAIKHGARSIYIPPRQELTNNTIPLNHTSPNLDGLVYIRNVTQHVTGEHDIVDVSQHFGCVATGEDLPARKYKLCKMPTPPIQAPIDPRAYPVYNTNETKPLQCDTSAPPIILPANSFVQDFSLYGALYLPDAYWALPIYDEDDSKLIDLTWKLTVQKLLWYQQSKLLVWHNRINEETIKTKGENGDLHVEDDRQQSLKIVVALKQWTCKGNFSVCAVNTVAYLAMNALITDEFELHVSRWFDAPEMSKFHSQRTNVNDTCNGEPVLYHSLNYNQQPLPKKGDGQWEELYYKPMMNINSSRELLFRTCDNVTSPGQLAINFTAPWQQRADILLVIMFNWPNYNSVPYIEAMYRPFFPYMIYCGPGFPDTRTYPVLRELNYNFVSYGNNYKTGYYNYKCITMVMTINFNIKGYLVVADDVLPVLPKVLQVQEQEVMFEHKSNLEIVELTTVKLCIQGNCSTPTKWMWWKKEKNNILSALSRLQREKRTSTVVNLCQRELINLTGSKTRAIGVAYSGDIYYIPKRLQSKFVELSYIFLEEKVFLEIAVPTIVACITRNWDGMVGYHSPYDANRDKPWLHFNRHNMVNVSYMHPAKWSSLANEEKVISKSKQFFCAEVLPFLNDKFVQYLRD